MEPFLRWFWVTLSGPVCWLWVNHENPLTVWLLEEVAGRAWYYDDLRAMRRVDKDGK